MTKNIAWHISFYYSPGETVLILYQHLGDTQMSREPDVLTCASECS